MQLETWTGKNYLIPNTNHEIEQFVKNDIIQK